MLAIVRSLILFLALASAGGAYAARLILVYGDSLSAGYGLAREQSWPALLDQRLKADRLDYSVVNASISGETTAGGRSRLEAALNRHHPDIMILALGANDGLRGLPVSVMQDNLAAMIRMAREHKARTLLAGMRLPPNYGPDYTRAFEQSFVAVARREKVPLLPFLLEPIAGNRSAFQADNLHPVAEAEPKIVDHVWKALKSLL